jgi:rhombotail lipoprotein
LVDLAVIDPATRSLVIRAGGTDTRHGNTTLVDERLATRTAQAEGFGAATDQLMAHFDAALTQFESDVKAGKAQVRVVDRRTGKASSGGGSLGGAILAVLVVLLAIQRVRMFRRRLTRYRMGLR